MAKPKSEAGDAPGKRKAPFSGRVIEAGRTVRWELTRLGHVAIRTRSVVMNGAEFVLENGLRHAPHCREIDMPTISASRLSFT
jgi:hypothetical protein